MISVVLAAYNEEKNIKRCLDSVKAFADEIVVVDGSSQDRTREIARELGARVIKTTNKLNFHINKQMAIEAAEGFLILQLDADEVVDSQLANFIQHLHSQILKNPESVNYSAWWVKRKNLFMGHWFKKGGQYPDPVIRLFIKGEARLPQKDVHEQMEVEGEVGWAQGHLLHYSNPSFKDYWRKFQTYTSFKAQQLREQKLRLNLKNIFAYLFYKPIATFINIFVLNKGFVDGIYGFIFAFFSGLHHAVAFLKLAFNKTD
jgi:glycosyltransferase involved in cell wall biosynthesis